MNYSDSVVYVLLCACAPCSPDSLSSIIQAHLMFTLSLSPSRLLSLFTSLSRCSQYFVSLTVSIVCAHYARPKAESIRRMRMHACRAIWHEL